MQFEPVLGPDKHAGSLKSYFISLVEKFKISSYGAQFEKHLEENNPLLVYPCEIISIFHGCMVWIEKSGTRVTDRHHEACRVMPSSDPE